MNRRTFIKSVVSTAALAALPIPFFTPAKNPRRVNFIAQERIDIPDMQYTLTQEMIERAAQLSAMNMGAPDMLIMSEDNYKALERYYT